ncbi:MAG TPA: formate dehydrogenase accessory sulfurtransferase FdhD [Syntrophales bacterium]|nr:formate dehydrogenase accessory sulfurtransferase FdhD [Syntrophales bacterium]
MKKDVTLIRMDREIRETMQGEVAREYPLTILFNDEQLATLLCSPDDMENLAVGFLYSEGLVGTQGEIRDVSLDEERGIIRVATDSTAMMDRELFLKRVITTGCGRGISFYNFADLEHKQQKVESDVKVTPAQILDLMKAFQTRSEIYQKTHGVHGAALCDASGILLFKEDIGRHNAIDKIFGHCLREGIVLADRIIMTTGRISSEILFKVAKRNIPILVSRSTPTDLAVGLAEELGITLVGYVRGGHMNVYAEAGRIG